MVPGGGSGQTNIQRIPLQDQELLDDQPLYVNAKQYHRILKRRQQRAKLEAQGKIPKERQVQFQTMRAIMSALKLLIHINVINYLSKILSFSM